MKANALLFAAALGIVVGLQPVHGDAGGQKIDIPFGYLMPDTSCPGATHVVLNPCPPNAPYFYLSFQPGRNVDRLIGMNVTVRGTIDPNATCSAPLVRVTKIAETQVVPPCPPPPCDNPPCP